MPSVFLSHSSKDKFFARKLAEELSKFGIKVWIDEAEMKVGDSLIDKISHAIDKSDYVAAILSNNSVQSNWVKKELHIAMTREIEGRNLTILPILIEQCLIPSFLQDKLYADFTDTSKFDDALSKILDAIGVKGPAAPKNVTAEIVKPKPQIKREVINFTNRTLESFVDISIVGADKSRAYRPDKNSPLYHIYLTLSAHPPQEWVQIFEAERKFPRHSMWRHAWIEGNSIVVHCVPNEIKQYHLDDLKHDVSNSNLRYREYLQKVAARKVRESREQRKLMANLDDSLDGLDI